MRISKKVSLIFLSVVFVGVIMIILSSPPPIDVKVREIKQLTFELKNEHPAWSPDGKKIAFSSNRNREWNIYIMDADGGNLIRLTEVPSGTPAWSPDGRKIAFLRKDIRKGGIYIVNIEGSNLTQVTDAGWNPSWSPDGTMIAFERVVGAPSSIIIKNVTSYREIYYYRWPGEYSPALYLPVWSPDGSKIAFWQASEIYIGDTPTTIDDARIESSSDPREGLFPANVTPLGPHASYGIPGFHGRVSWSPDSKMLAFDRLSGDHYDIFAIRVDGTGLVKLASGWEPAWSPDGDKIAFVKDGQIHVMYLDFTPTEESFPVAPTLFIVLAIVLGSATFLLKHKKKS